ESGDVAARVRRATAEIQSVNRRAIVPGSGKWPVVTDLGIRKRSHQQITVTHVGKFSLGVEGRAAEPVDHRAFGYIWGVAGPEFKHAAAVIVPGSVPIGGGAPQVVRQLLPHERGVHSGRRLCGIEHRGTRTPHYLRRKLPSFV